MPTGEYQHSSIIWAASGHHEIFSIRLPVKAEEKAHKILWHPEHMQTSLHILPQNEEKKKIRNMMQAKELTKFNNYELVL